MSLDRRKLENVKDRADGGYDAQCPICFSCGRDTDKDNLRVWADDSYKCICGCDTKEIFAMAGEAKPSRNGHAPSRPAKPSASKIRRIDKIPDHVVEGEIKASFVRSYQYEDEQGKPLYAVARYAMPPGSDKKKTFRQYPVVEGGYLTGEGCMKGIRLVPFKLPLVAGSDSIIVVEGERDVETLEALGYVATCNPGGAEKWREEWSHYFESKNIVVFPDNDEPGHRHADQVEAALKPGAKSFKRATVPAPSKDISEALTGKEGKEARNIVEELISSAESTSSRATSICDITCEVSHDPDELLKHRFLCRGGGAMLNGPTGVGKSSFIMQAAILWSLGKPFFGIEPARPLKSVIVQAENDDGDLVEQREGVFTGLGLSIEEKNLVRERVFVKSVNSETGAALITKIIRPLLREHRPDLQWLDNMFAYCGCNVINPLIQEFRCGIIIGHHTNKPPSGEQKADWSVSETAYMGSGTGELANWPRAILSIRALKTDGVFELVAGKRGRRLRWKDAEGKTTCRRHIAHSTDGLIYWRDADADEVPAKAGKKQKHFVEDILRLLGEQHLGATEWQKLCHREKGISNGTFYDLKTEAEKSKRIAQDDGDKWFKVV
jgi:5S rRNA maturation endonuclease (ribonuclease M5)